VAEVAEVAEVEVGSLFGVDASCVCQSSPQHHLLHELLLLCVMRACAGLSIAPVVVWQCWCQQLERPE